MSYRKIGPMRVGRFDKVELPLPSPVLELLFSKDRRFHRGMHLEPHEAFHIVALGEAVESSFAVLPQPGREIGCHADIKRAARLAGEDVDARRALFAHDEAFAAQWTLKQVQGDGRVLAQ